MIDSDGVKTWSRTVALRIKSLPELFSNVLLNWRRQHRPHASIIDLSRATFHGQSAIVTGANAGIGLDLSLALARRGAHVIMACRSPERGQAAARYVSSELTARHDASCDDARALQPDHDGFDAEAVGYGTVEFLELDLASLHSVRSFAKAWKLEHCSAPDLIFCNAGIMAPPKRQLTSDGLELQFQVNYLSHWLLVRSLTEQRRHHRPNHKARFNSCRVVLASSCTHTGGRFDFSDLQAQRHYNGLQSYANSKLALVIAAKQFQQRFDRSSNSSCHHTAVAVDPGILNTSLARGFFHQQVPSLLQPLLLPLVDLCLRAALLPAAVATESLLWAASAPAEQVKGLFIKHGAVAAPSKKAGDEVASRVLWQESCKLTGSNDTDGSCDSD